MPVVTPSPSATPNPALIPVALLVPTPTPSSTPTPTAVPTVTPAPSPTPSPTVTPTPSPSPTATASPTPSPTPTPWPEGHIYTNLGGDGLWRELTAFLGEYPWTTFEYDPDAGYYFSVQGYELDNRCRSDGRFHEDESTGSYFATQDCIDDYKVRCGRDYRDEIIPAQPGCLDDEYSSGYGGYFLNVANLGVLGKPWVADGVSQEEIAALRSLDDLFDTRGHGAMLGGRLGEEWATVRIADMPFLETLEPEDERALWGLGVVAESETYFRVVLSHPLLHGGITDGMTGAIASLGRIVIDGLWGDHRKTDAEIVQELQARLDSAYRQGR